LSQGITYSEEFGTIEDASDIQESTFTEANPDFDTQVSYSRHNLFIIEFILDIPRALDGFPHDSRLILLLVLAAETRPHDNHGITHEFDDITSILAKGFNHALHVAIDAEG